MISSKCILKLLITDEWSMRNKSNVKMWIHCLTWDVLWLHNSILHSHVKRKHNEVIFLSIMRQHEYTYMTKLSIIMIFGNEVLEYYLKLIHHLRDILFIEKMTMMTGLCLLDEYLTATKLQVLKVVGTFWRDKLIFNCLVQDIEHSNFNSYPPI